jgi:hypothetical protein
MRRESVRAIGEMELAQMNARADARSAFRADDWDDAVALGANDREMLNDSFALDLGDEYE